MPIRGSRLIPPNDFQPSHMFVTDQANYSMSEKIPIRSRTWQVGTLTYTFGGLAALFGWLLWRSRKRYASVLAVVLATTLFTAVSAAALLINGCGGITAESAPAGTYVVQVTGTGVNSNVIAYGTLTVTVTK